VFGSAAVLMAFDRSRADDTEPPARASGDLLQAVVHTVVGTAANVSDVTQAHAPVHGDECEVFGDAGYQDVENREKDAGRKGQVAHRDASGHASRLEPGHRAGPTARWMREIQGTHSRQGRVKRQFGNVKVR
jgi:IS5 family transposase